MKVLMVAPTMFHSGRGTSMRIEAQAEALLSKGCQVTLITYGLGEGPVHLTNQGLSIKRIVNFFPWATSIPSGFSLYKIFADILLFFKVCSFLMLHDVEKIHAYLHEGALVSFVASKLVFWKKYKTVADLHGSLTSEMDTGFFKPILKKLESVIHGLSDIVTVSSFELGKYISKDSKNKPVFIFDVANIRGMEKVVRVKDKTSILYTGGFGKEKGVDVLSQLMRSVQRDNIHWIIAGAPLKELVIPTDIDKETYTIISPLSKDKLEDLLASAGIAIDPKKNVLQGSGKLVNYMKGVTPPVVFLSETTQFYLGAAYKELAGSSIEELTQIVEGLSRDKQKRLRLESLIRSRSKEFNIERLGDLLVSL